MINEIFDPSRSYEDQQSSAQQHFQQKFFAVKDELNRFVHLASQREKEFITAHPVGYTTPSLGTITGLIQDLEENGNTKALHAIAYLKQMRDIAQKGAEMTKEKTTIQS